MSDPTAYYSWDNPEGFWKGRCGAMITTSLTGRRCRKIAEPDTDPPRCATHLGINMLEKGHNNPKLLNGEGYMTRFYYKTFKPKLAERVQELLEEAPPIEQLSINEELALIRQGASHAVAQYSDLLEKREKGEQISEHALMISADMMQDHLRKVIEAVESAGKLEEVKQKVAGTLVNCMNMVVTAVMRAAFDAFGDDCRMATFKNKLDEHLVWRGLPAVSGEEPTGTLLTPDQDVIMMDSSVPRSQGE